MMKQIAVLAFTALSMTGALSESVRLQAVSLDVAAVGGPVHVTVNYKGKGTVDARHRVWVWLFDTPDIGPGAMPIAEMSVEKNGSIADFQVDAGRVWIAVAYDESGTMSGNAPPPSGSPVSIYMSSTGAPEPVTPGDKGAATLTFDDSQRMP